MRSTLLAIWLAGSAALGAEVRDTAYWCAQLRYLGCTAHAHEVSAMFGDDIADPGPDADLRRVESGRGDAGRRDVRAA